MTQGELVSVFVIAKPPMDLIPDVLAAQQAYQEHKSTPLNTGSHSKVQGINAAMWIRHAPNMLHKVSVALENYTTDIPPSVLDPVPTTFSTGPSSTSYNTSSAWTLPSGSYAWCVQLKLAVKAAFFNQPLIIQASHHAARNSPKSDSVSLGVISADENVIPSARHSKMAAIYAYAAAAADSTLLPFPPRSQQTVALTPIPRPTAPPTRRSVSGTPFTVSSFLSASSAPRTVHGSAYITVTLENTSPNRIITVQALHVHLDDSTSPNSPTSLQLGSVFQPTRLDPESSSSSLHLVTLEPGASYVYVARMDRVRPSSHNQSTDEWFSTLPSPEYVFDTPISIIWATKSRMESCLPATTCTRLACRWRPSSSAAFAQGPPLIKAATLKASMPMVQHNRAASIATNFTATSPTPLSTRPSAFPGAITLTMTVPDEPVALLEPFSVQLTITNGTTSSADLAVLIMPFARAAATPGDMALLSPTAAGAAGAAAAQSRADTIVSSAASMSRQPSRQQSFYASAMPELITGTTSGRTRGKSARVNVRVSRNRDGAGSGAESDSYSYGGGGDELSPGSTGTLNGVELGIDNDSFSSDSSSDDYDGFSTDGDLDARAASLVITPVPEEEEDGGLPSPTTTSKRMRRATKGRLAAGRKSMQRLGGAMAAKLLKRKANNKRRRSSGAPSLMTGFPSSQGGSRHRSLSVNIPKSDSAMSSNRQSRAISAPGPRPALAVFPGVAVGQEDGHAVRRASMASLSLAWSAAAEETAAPAPDPSPLAPKSRSGKPPLKRSNKGLSLSIPEHTSERGSLLLRAMDIWEEADGPVIALEKGVDVGRLGAHSSVSLTLHFVAVKPGVSSLGPIFVVDRAGKTPDTPKLMQHAPQIVTR